ncbi:MAG: hypothetical protein Kow0047_32110 [Anaerolineae bacterium]
MTEDRIPRSVPPEEFDEPDPVEEGEEFLAPEEDVLGMDEMEEPQPIYGRPPERRLGREIPIWALGAGVLIVIGLIALIISAISGGGEPEGTPTPDPTLLAQQATAQAAIATPTPIPPTPTPTPTPVPTLGPGAKARIINSDPEGLALRAGPGRSFQIQFLLRDGMIVDILPPTDLAAEYPVEADGYKWWHIQTENGLEGWVAQGDAQQEWLELVIP